MRLMQLIRWFATKFPAPFVWRDRRAVTNIEYVIIAIIIAVAILGGLSKVGGYIGTDFNDVSVEL